MRGSFKKLFRRRKKDKKEPGSSDFQSEEANTDSKPVSSFHFQPPDQQRSVRNSSSSSQPTTQRSAEISIGSNEQRSRASSDIAPTPETLDHQATKRSPISSPRHTDTSKPAQTMTSTISPAAAHVKDDTMVESAGDPDTTLSDVAAAAMAFTYDSVPVLEQTRLPRGGVSVDTKAVGRVQVRIHMHSLYEILDYVLTLDSSVEYCLLFFRSMVFHQKQSKIV